MYRFILAFTFTYWLVYSHCRLVRVEKYSYGHLNRCHSHLSVDSSLFSCKASNRMTKGCNERTGERVFWWMTIDIGCGKRWDSRLCWMDGFCSKVTNEKRWCFVSVPRMTDGEGNLGMSQVSHELVCSWRVSRLGNLLSWNALLHIYLIRSFVWTFTKQNNSSALLYSILRVHAEVSHAVTQFDFDSFCHRRFIFTWIIQMLPHRRISSHATEMSMISA